MSVSPLTVVHTPDDVLRVLPIRVGVPRVVVMTMGALHEGHLTLVRHARTLAGADGDVIVTVYVNPLQFGPEEDFEHYPRQLDADVAALQGLGVDLVFAPDDEVMYPHAIPAVSVTTGRAGQIFEGQMRPGHFDGVATVVLKLMNIVQPTVAIFGQKDAQQLLIVRRMVKDLNIPVDIEGFPIVRESDGLARSSRNAYLSTDERTQAVILSQSLSAAQAAASTGADATEVRQVALDSFSTIPHIVPDYLELVDPDTVEPVAPAFTGEALLIVAAKVGPARLLDNMTITIR